MSEKLTDEDLLSLCTLAAELRAGVAPHGEGLRTRKGERLERALAELRALRRENYDLRTAVIHVADSAAEYHRVRAMVGRFRNAANLLHVPFDLAAVLATDDGAK